MFYLPDTQEAIVSQAQFDRVQELRKNKRRPAKAERQGFFSGILFCADCGGKRTQKVKIYFNFVDDVEIPVISETITTETTYGRRKTA